MKIIFTTILVTSLLFSKATHTFANTPPVSAIDKNIPDERVVKNFNGIIAGGPIDVVVKLGDKEGLRFEGDAEAIATLIAEVKGDKLVIRPQTSWVSWAKKYENKKITAYVSAKQLSSLTMSGNGTITVSGTITAADFALSLSGSGSIKATVNADKITSVLSGSGNINLEGKADLASVTLSGPGTFGSTALSVKALSSRISGKGSITIKTDGKISAFISGSGHVYYTGSPQIDKTVIGSGGVVER